MSKRTDHDYIQIQKQTENTLIAYLGEIHRDKISSLVSEIYKDPFRRKLFLDYDPNEDDQDSLDLHLEDPELRPGGLFSLIYTRDLLGNKKFISIFVDHDMKALNELEKKAQMLWQYLANFHFLITDLGVPFKKILNDFNPMTSPANSQVGYIKHDLEKQLHHEYTKEVEKALQGPHSLFFEELNPHETNKKIKQWKIAVVKLLTNNTNSISNKSSFFDECYKQMILQKLNAKTLIGFDKCLSDGWSGSSPAPWRFIDSLWDVYYESNTRLVSSLVQVLCNNNADIEPGSLHEYFKQSTEDTHGKYFEGSSLLWFLRKVDLINLKESLSLFEENLDPHDMKYSFYNSMLSKEFAIKDNVVTYLGERFNLNCRQLAIVEFLYQNPQGGTKEEIKKALPEEYSPKKNDFNENRITRLLHSAEVFLSKKHKYQLKIYVDSTF